MVARVVGQIAREQGAVEVAAARLTCFVPITPALPEERAARAAVVATRAIPAARAIPVVQEVLAAQQTLIV